MRMKDFINVHNKVKFLTLVQLEINGQGSHVFNVFLVLGGPCKTGGFLCQKLVLHIFMEQSTIKDNSGNLSLSVEGYLQ